MEFDSVKTKYLTSHSMGVGAMEIGNYDKKFRDRVNKHYRGCSLGGW